MMNAYIMPKGYFNPPAYDITRSLTKTQELNVGAHTHFLIVNTSLIVNVDNRRCHSASRLGES
jgi:hypothetical protein